MSCMCVDSGFAFFRVQKKTTSMSLTIRSASPKTPEGLPLRSTLVQALSQPPQRVSTHCTQASRSAEAHCPKSGDIFSVTSPLVQTVYFYCLLDAKPSVLTVWWWGVRSSCVHQGQSVCTCLHTSEPMMIITQLKPALLFSDVCPVNLAAGICSHLASEALKSVQASQVLSHRKPCPYENVFMRLGMNRKDCCHTACRIPLSKIFYVLCL